MRQLLHLDLLRPSMSPLPLRFVSLHFSELVQLLRQWLKRHDCRFICPGCRAIRLSLWRSVNFDLGIRDGGSVAGTISKHFLSLAVFELTLGKRERAQTVDVSPALGNLADVSPVLEPFSPTGASIDTETPDDSSDTFRELAGTLTWSRCTLSDDLQLFVPTFFF